MQKNSWWHWLILAAAVIGSIIVVNPPLDTKDDQGRTIRPGKIKFGLDLQGGTSFTVAVDRDELRSRLRERSPDMTDEQIDAAIAKDKSQERNFAVGRFTILSRIDEARAQTYALDAARRFYAKEPMPLNQFAWMIVMPNSQFKKPNYKVGLQIAQMAANASNNADPDILDTLALAQYRQGQKAVAVKTQTRAVALARKLNRPAQSIEEMQGRLKQFQQGR